MASVAGPASRPSPTRFPRALLRVIAANKHEKRPCQVRLAISHSLFWMPLENDDSDAPHSLYDFSNQSSLELKRIGDATWDVIADAVKPHDNENLSLVVPGRLHGKARWKTLSGAVKIVITASTERERDAWMYAIRLRISPSQVLRQRSKELLAVGGSYIALYEMALRMQAMHVTVVGGQHVGDIASLLSTVVLDSSSSTSRLASVSDRVYSGTQKVEWIEKFNSQLSGLAGIIASAVKKYADSEMAANTAQDFVDFAKFIPGGVGAIFQLVAVSAKLAVMYAEANRGCRELPELLPKLVDLLVYVARSVAPIVQFNHDSDPTDAVFESNVFEVLVKTLDLMGKLEAYLMRGKWGQLINSAVVKEIEKELVMLKDKVVSVALANRVKTMDGDMTDIKMDVEEVVEDLSEVRNDVNVVKKEVNVVESRVFAVESRIDVMDTSSNLNLVPTGPPPRPKPSPHFVGRGCELLELRKIVEKYGSAAITGLGGLGKSQVLTAFAEAAECDKVTPRIVYWIIADGDASKVVEALASLVEYLLGYGLSSDDRVNARIVVGALRNALAKLNRPWLLCLDNVDGAGESDVSGVLNEVVSLTGNKGWVVLTSRAGTPLLWSRMKLEQNLALQPLSEEFSMCLLWRLRESLDTSEANDATILGYVRRHEEESPVEFQALRELCGSDWRYSLAGLPLALVQAGAYIRHRRCLFSKYLKLYRQSSEKAKLSRMMRKSEEFSPVREEQRAILTTWKISVDILSRAALSLLKAASILGNAAIPEELFKGLLNEVVNVETDEIEELYSGLVLDELAFGSSLVQRTQYEDEDCFDIHRLVRLFVLVDMSDDPTEQVIAFNGALRATHRCLAAVLKASGRSFYDKPTQLGEPPFAFVPHTHSIILHHQRRISSVHNSFIVDMYVFTGRSLLWYGRMSDAENVFRGYLALLYDMHGRESEHPSIADALALSGSICLIQEKLHEAQSMLRKALQIRYSIQDPDAPDLSVAFTLGKLGLVYKSLGSLDDAESMLEKNLQMLYEIDGSDLKSLSVASSLYSLGDVYQDQGKFEQAEAAFQKTLEMLNFIHGADTNHRDVARTLQILGNVYRFQGRLDEAEFMFRKTLEMEHAIYGVEVNHPAVAGTLYNLGDVYRAQGKLDEAEAMFQKTLQMEHAIHGADGIQKSMAVAYNQLGIVYNHQGRLDDACAMLQKTLQIRHAIHGADTNHPDVAGTYYNLGIVYQAQGRLEKANSVLQKTLQMQYAIYGAHANHPAVAGTLYNLGDVYREQGRLDEAESTFQKTLQIVHAIHGTDANHPDVTRTLQNLGNVYKAQGRLDEAESMFRKILQMDRAFHGADDRYLP